jgi:site-specific recombinase XerD
VNTLTIPESSSGHLAQNPAAVYLADLSPGSRRTMHRALDTMAELLTNGHIVDAFALSWAAYSAHTGALRSVLAERYAPTTANKHLAALHGVLRAAWRLGQLDTDTYLRAVDLKAVPGLAVPVGRDLSAGELGALVETCAADPNTAAGIRDAAIIGLLSTAGLRRAELAALRLTDYDATARRLLVRGKGNRERYAYPAAGALAALDDWLALRGTEEGGLFVPVLKSGAIVQGSGITSQAVYNLMQKRAAQAAVKAFSPHDLRRTFVGNLLDAGADIATVQQLVGHANINTTARYDRRGERARHEAAALLHFPYRER